MTMLVCYGACAAALQVGPLAYDALHAIIMAHAQADPLALLQDYSSSSSSQGERRCL